MQLCHISYSTKANGLNDQAIVRSFTPEWGMRV
jgi:hypothetical protein